jgi:hypothetical protein
VWVVRAAPLTLRSRLSALAIVHMLAMLSFGFCFCSSRCSFISYILCALLINQQHTRTHSLRMCCTPCAAFQSRTAPGGLTALHCAAENDAAEAALMLLEHHADPLIRETMSWMPIHCASWNRSTATVMVLLARGADPTRRVTDGDRCAGMLAQDKGHPDIVALLMSSRLFFSHRVWAHPLAASVEKRVLLHVALCMRRAAQRGTVPNLPAEVVLEVFGFCRRRDLWRSGISLQEYRPGCWHLPHVINRAGR